MINRIYGTVIEKNDKHIVLLIGNLIGLDIWVQDENKFNINGNYLFYVSSVFNAEKGYTFYGFTSEIEKKYFIILCDCHGIGARLALTVLGGVSITDLYQAVKQKDQKLLESIPGIGKKKAENIIIDLYRKIDKLPFVNSDFDNSIWADLSNALESIGYNRYDIKKITHALLESEFTRTMSLPQLVQAALQLKI